MILYRSIFPTPESVKARQLGISVFVALIGVALFALAFGTLIPPPGTAHARSSES